jgi:hypothetical protein
MSAGAPRLADSRRLTTSVASAGGAGAEAQAGGPAAEGLPEQARVYWRPRVDVATLSRTERLWTLSTAAHTMPFIAAAVLLGVVAPVTTPVALVLIAHAWIIPELYAARGAGVLRVRAPGGEPAEQRALLLLGDLIDDPARRLHGRTGVVLQRGELGAWIVGEAGALLVRPGGRRVDCYCVKATGSDLPHADRIAHLLLALRCDEYGFVTVANLTFSGACWRLRRRLRTEHRDALLAARAAAR